MQSLGDQEIKVFVEAARLWLFGEQHGSDVLVQ